jgi:hypothetical protein
MDLGFEISPPRDGLNNFSAIHPHRALLAFVQESGILDLEKKYLYKVYFT